MRPFFSQCNRKSIIDCISSKFKFAAYALNLLPSPTHERYGVRTRRRARNVDEYIWRQNYCHHSRERIRRKLPSIEVRSQHRSIEYLLESGTVGASSSFGSTASAQAPTRRHPPASSIGAAVGSDLTPSTRVPVRAVPSRLSRLTSSGMSPLCPLVRSRASHCRCEETEGAVHPGKRGGV